MNCGCDDSIATEAADFAARAHWKQRRKDAEATPYINHLTEVAWLLADAGCGLAIVAAGYLHDTIEDTGVTYQALADRFGSEVAELVRAVTDDKSLPKAERKQKQVERAASATHEVAALKLADKVSNLIAIRDRPPADWPKQRIAEYVEWAHRVVTNLPDPNPRLMERYHSVRKDLLALS